MKNIFDRQDVFAAFSGNAWQLGLFREFEATVSSETRPFPCIFGVAGLKTNQLRFAFPDPFDAPSTAACLREYLPQARSLGPNTSLVIISRPGPVRAIDAYRRQFWALLRQLADVDRQQWPIDVPEVLDTPGWEFCFGGEPIFVVCNTPAHVLRQSRRSTSLIVTFQPRWVFDAIGSQAIFDKAVSKIRKRLNSYDLISASPDLGRYGDTENREFAQYFLGDTNERPVCPFHALTEKKEQVA